MISTTTIRERPQLLSHSLTDSNLLHHRHHHHHRSSSSTSSWPDKLKVTTVDISLLLKPKDEDTSHSTDGTIHDSKASSTTPGTVTVAGSPSSVTQHCTLSANLSNAIATPGVTATRASLGSLGQNAASGLNTLSSIPAKRSSRPFDHPTSESPAKKQSKWSPEEDAKIIQLRGDGMKWEDISKHLPGRSAISCRLHYQNYLERRSEWDEDRKNKLARLYERFKSDMWSRIAEEMAIPWRAAEAMHWQMGEQEMARRAGVTPFSLTTNLNQQQHSAGNGVSQHTRPQAHIRSNSATPRMRRDSHNHSLSHSSTTSAFNTAPPPATMSLAPPQLPSLAELTAGIPAYSANGNHGLPSPSSLTPPQHPYTHTTANVANMNGHSFAARYSNSQSLPPPPNTQAAMQSSRP